MESIQLPVNENVGFVTECYHNCRLSILLADKQFYGWYYSHFINLLYKFTPKDNFPLLQFEDHVQIYSEVLNEEPVVSNSNISLQIKNGIRHGEYFLMYLNWKNIKDSNYFGLRDMIHEGLIFGFDDNIQSFNVLAFEVNGRRFSRINIPYDQCEKEYYEILRKKVIQDNKWFSFYGFPLMKIKLKIGEIPRIDKTKIFFSLDRWRLHTELKEYFGVVAGNHVHKYLGNFFKRKETINNEYYQFWNIMIYKIIYHKLIMIERIKFINKKENNSFYNKIIQLYEKSYKHIKAIRKESMKYQRVQQEDVLLEISKLFYNIYDLENRSISLLMDILVHERIGTYS